MTGRDDFELVLRREGLTQPQTTAVLDAAETYATSQARLAIGALGCQPPQPAVMHLLDIHAKTFTACGQPGVNPTRRGDGTCGQCREATGPSSSLAGSSARLTR